MAALSKALMSPKPRSSARITTTLGKRGSPAANGCCAQAPAANNVKPTPELNNLLRVEIIYFLATIGPSNNGNSISGATATN
jgi:hypothetical protein